MIVHIPKKFVHLALLLVIVGAIIAYYQTNKGPNSSNPCVNAYATSKAASHFEIPKSDVYTDLEKALENLEAVCALDLNEQNLDIFPAEISSFPHLISLKVADNNIEMLPPEISNLKELRTLVLSKNKLASLPKEII